MWRFLIALTVVIFSTHAEAVVIKQVRFVSQEQTLVGNLYLPDDYKFDMKLPGVVVTGAWTTVKEQMAGTYAKALAQRGYAALVFDFRGWGQSQDEIQYLEDPQRKIEDINAAVNYLVTRSEIDPERVGGLGICASSGYMSDAAYANSHIKSLALVAPWLHNAQIVNAVYGGDEGVRGLIEASRAAAEADDPVIVEAASVSNDKAVMYQAPYYTETDRGLIPEYDNKFNVASWEGWLTYDAIRTADDLKKHTLLVHSKAAAIPQGAQEYARRMGKHATTLWLDNITQFDFYDDPDAVRKASDAVASHFENTLK